MTQPRSASPPETLPDKPHTRAGGYAMERVAPRTPGSLVPGIQRVRLLPLGIEGTIVDISTRGALILCSRKLGSGMEVRVIFEGTSPPKPASGRIVRSLVSAMGRGGELWYHVGISFDAPIEFESISGAQRQLDEPSEQPDPSPIQPKFVNRW